MITNRKGRKKKKREVSLTDIMKKEVKAEREKFYSDRNPA